MVLVALAGGSFPVGLMTLARRTCPVVLVPLSLPKKLEEATPVVEVDLKLLGHILSRHNGRPCALSLTRLGFCSESDLFEL